MTISYAIELTADTTSVRVGELTKTVDPLSSRGPTGLPCQVRDPDLWFAESPAELEQAKAYCTDCPAIAACFAGAIERGEPWGVWGGQIFARGAVLAQKRGRGRPRKGETPVAA